MLTKRMSSSTVRSSDRTDKPRRLNFHRCDGVPVRFTLTAEFGH